MCYGTTKTFEIAPICYFCYCYKYVNHDIFSVIWNTSSTWETHLKSSICAYLCNRLQPHYDVPGPGHRWGRPVCLCPPGHQWPVVSSPAPMFWWREETVTTWHPGYRHWGPILCHTHSLVKWRIGGAGLTVEVDKMMGTVSVPWYITVTIQWLDNHSAYIHVKTPCYIWVWICAGWSFP